MSPVFKYTLRELFVLLHFWKYFNSFIFSALGEERHWQFIWLQELYQTTQKSFNSFVSSTVGRKNVSGVQLRDLQYTSERFSTHFLLLYVTWTVVNFSKSFQSFVILSSLFDTALNPPEFNSNSLSDAEAQRINQTNKQNMQTQQTLSYMYKCNWQTNHATFLFLFCCWNY